MRTDVREKPKSHHYVIILVIVLVVAAAVSAAFILNNGAVSPGGNGNEGPPGFPQDNNRPGSNQNLFETGDGSTPPPLPNFP